jgi:Myb/SANT-like DNA-binding domain
MSGTQKNSALVQIQNKNYTTFFKINFSVFSDLETTHDSYNNSTLKHNKNHIYGLNTMSEATKETTRTDWNERNKQFFVHAMMNEAARGNFVDNSFKKSSWRAIADEFRLKSGCKYDKSQLHSHYAVLKKKYHIYKALQDYSGFGVDPNTGGPTAPVEVSSSYIQAHPDAAQFRYKPFTLFDVL